MSSPSYAEIIKNLLFVLGLEANPNTGTLVYTDTHQPLLCSQKFIKINTDPENKVIFIGSDDVLFDPLAPKCTSLTEKIFEAFLANESNPDNPDRILDNVLVYYFDRDIESKKYRLNVKFSQGDTGPMYTWSGNWYYNKVVCFVEGIFSLDGTFEDIDLTDYDIHEENITTTT